MIISHKHKFIFFKTRKTAGSSIQVALAKHCGENDIITGQYRLGVDDNSHSAGLNMNEFYTNHPHPDLIPTKQFLSSDIWDSYFKFAFVRNPFDIAVSRYHWNIKGKDYKPETSIKGFNKWVKEENLTNEDHLHRYIFDNQIDLDFIGRYENLNNDLQYIYEKLNLPKSDLPKLKSGFRNKTHYTKFYNKETKQIVSNFFKKDLELFNYNFNKDFQLTNPKSIINKNIIKDNNINGPSLIKVPESITNKLGKYYLYFANHDGNNIRMAYSDNLNGPWNLYKPGTLHLENTSCKTHIASPDVHIEGNKIIMYYHGDTDNGQLTFKATSNDGLNFKTDKKSLGVFYFRVFKYLNETYAIAKNKNIDGIIYKKINNDFIPQFNLINNIRHTAVYVNLDTLYIFYTIVGDVPESLYICKIKNWEVIDNYKFKEPNYEWEGAYQPKVPSKFGSALGFVNELRDPCIFEEDDNLYLLYSYGGESGIAISKLEKI